MQTNHSAKKNFFLISFTAIFSESVSSMFVWIRISKRSLIRILTIMTNPHSDSYGKVRSLIYTIKGFSSFVWYCIHNTFKIARTKKAKLSQLRMKQFKFLCWKKRNSLNLLICQTIWLSLKICIQS